MTEASACGQNQRACAREAFGGGVGVACLFGGWCLVSPPRCATDRLVLLLSSVGRAGPGAATDAGSSTAATVGTSSTADKELEEVPRTVIDKAKTYAQHMEAVVNSLPHMRQTLMSGYIEELCKEFMCSQDVARRALNAATMPEATDALLSPGSSTEQSMHDISTSPRASPEGASGVAASGQLLPAHDLPMWDDRANWIINEHNDKELVYELVKRLVLDDPIMKDLLSWCLNDSDITIFVQRPEQSGKTFVCVLLAWLSNICYGQAAYVLLRSGGGAREDYDKFCVDTVENLNRKIWEAMLGYTFSGVRPSRVYTKLPADQYAKRVYKAELPSDPAREGYMKPYELHAFNLHSDRKLEGERAQEVMKNKYPILFSRLATASNIARSVVNEMETLIHAYGVDEHGFARMTLFNDEYQQHTTHGIRSQEELHEPICTETARARKRSGVDEDENLPLFRWSQLFDVNASAISRSDLPRGQDLAELKRRFKKWEEADPEQRENVRLNRSSFSACLRGQVRISATCISGMVSSESWDMRRAQPIVLAVDPSYYGHAISEGMDRNKDIKTEWRGSSNLEHIHEPDYSHLDIVKVLGGVPRLQKFVLDEVVAEVRRDGYGHVIVQSLGSTSNASLLEMARFFIGFTDNEIPERPTIAVTAYKFTTAGAFPGGPWLVFSQAALPLRGLIADISEEVYIDDVVSKGTPLTNVPPGKVPLPKGAQIAPGIRNNIVKHHGKGLDNALQLPRHESLFLKNILHLVHKAIERKGIDKAQIKIISIGANQFKMGMTPKTLDHKMSPTLGLLNATERQEKNMTLEDICQGLHGRLSGSRDNDPYFEARGNQDPPRMVASGHIKDLLNAYKEIQKGVMRVAEERTKAGGNDNLMECMYGLRKNLSGYNDLDPSTLIWKSDKKRRTDGGMNGKFVHAVKENSTGCGASNVCKRLGFLYLRERDQMISKCADLMEEHPDLFEFSFQGQQMKMPRFESKIWKHWDTNMPWYQATVIDVEVNANLLLSYTICFDTDETGQPLEDDADKYVKYDVILDPEMREWSYENPNVDLEGGAPAPWGNGGAAASSHVVTAAPAFAGAGSCPPMTASGFGGEASATPVRGRGEGASSCSTTTPRPPFMQGKGKEPA